MAAKFPLLCTLFGGLIALSAGACSESEPHEHEGAVDAQVGAHDDAESRGDAQSDLSAQFRAGSLPESLSNGGYIDSAFMNKAGDRIYFLHSIFSPGVLDGRATQDDCRAYQTQQLPGHITTDGLEWNTDLYYVEWDGTQWSAPTNLGAPINSLGMECCMWLNADDTEIIFNRVTDLDGDGIDGDIGLPPSGNYRATRADRNSPWGEPVPLSGDYGTGDQSGDHYRHDIHQAPSGNLYLWEWFDNGDNLLRFGERTGGTDAEPTYASPVTIPGSTNFETQIWVNDEETRIVFNHRQANGDTELYTRTRPSTDADWGPPTIPDTSSFADSTGRTIWGEPSFDQTESYMIFIRFNTAESTCFTPEIMYSSGDVTTGFMPPVVLN